MPLLARMVPAPLSVDIGPGAIANLGTLLADRRISRGGHVAVVVGSGIGESIVDGVRHTLSNAETWTVSAGSVREGVRIATAIRKGFYDAVLGVGGGQTLDVAKYAATLTGLPLVAVATSLAHDGVASPVSSLEESGRKGSYGVHMPLAVVVDLDYVRNSPPAMRRSGIGDVLSNLSATADWQLAKRERGEVIDGLAAACAETAAEAVLGRDDGIDDEDFLSSLAEALVLSGVAMAAAGSSRPCSGGEHEIIHAIDDLFPGTASHGELAGVATLFMCYFREDLRLAQRIERCLRRHGLPRVPRDIGLTNAQFAEAACHAPATRPDRYTLLEHRNLSLPMLRSVVNAYARSLFASD